MELYEACENGNEERVVELLLSPDAGALLEEVDFSGRSPLHAACIGGQLTVVQLMLGRPCQVFFPGRSIDQVRTLLEDTGKMVNVDIRMKRKGDELVPSALVQLPTQSIIQEKDLIEGIKYVDNYGNAPILCVASFGCGTETKHIDEGLTIVKELLVSGCHANTLKHSNSWAPLHWCCFNGNSEMAALLLNPPGIIHGVSKFAPQQYAIPFVRSRDGFFPVDLAGRLALKLAAEMHRLRCFNDEADVGDDMIHEFEYRQWRLRLDHVQVIRVLVADFIVAAANVKQYAALNNVRSQHPRFSKRKRKMFSATDVIIYGQHLLFWCCGLNMLIEVEELLKLRFSNCDLPCLFPLYTVQMEDGRMHSALHFASAMGFATIVKALLEHIRITGHSYTRATKRGLKVLPVSGLKSASIDYSQLPGWTNDRQETPFFVAVVHNQLSVIQVFLDMLQPEQKENEIKLTNVEGTTPHHVATDAMRSLLDLPIRSIFSNEFVFVFDRDDASFRKTLSDVLEEESSRAPSLLVTTAGSYSLKNKKVLDYITVGALDLVIAERAEEMRIKLRKRGKSTREPFELKDKNTFEPFRSLHRQQIVLDVIRNNFNLARHLNNRLIKDVFQLHDERGCTNVYRQWLGPERERLMHKFKEYMREGSHFTYASLWPILTYFGEKQALYFAWMHFYTMWMLLIAPLCLLIEILVWSGYSAGIPYLAILVSLWTTGMVERWKRKRSELLCNWGLPQTSDINDISAEYHGDFVVDTTTNERIVQFPHRKRRWRILLGIPALMCMGVMTVLAFIVSKLAKSYQEPFGENSTMKSIAPFVSAIYAVVILILDWVYTRLAYGLTRWENHRTVNGYESMLAMKLFWFKFLNAFISLFSIAFYDQNFAALRSQLLTILIIRQLKNLAVNYVMPLLLVRYRWSKRGLRKTDMFEFNSPQAENQCTDFEQEFDVPKGIAVQELMYPSDLLLNKQIDIMMQFGYITMFLTVFPSAPFFAVLNNLLEMRLDVQCSIEAKRRPRYENDSEVTTFMSILEFMSFSAVTVNCGLLFLGTEIEVYIDWMWAPSTMMKKAVVVLILEHLLLGLKAMLAVMIPDMPYWVEKYYADLERMNNDLDSLADQTSLVSSSNTLTCDTDEKSSVVEIPQVAPSENTIIAPLQSRIKELEMEIERLKNQQKEIVTTKQVPIESEPPTRKFDTLPPTSIMETEANAIECTLCRGVDQVKKRAVLKCIDCKVCLCAACDKILHYREVALPGVPGNHIRVDITLPVQPDSARLRAIENLLSRSDSCSDSTVIKGNSLHHDKTQFDGSPEVLQMYLSNKAKLV